MISTGSCVLAPLQARINLVDRNIMVLESSDFVPYEAVHSYKLHERTHACKNRRQNSGVLSKELVPLFGSHRIANILRQILELCIQKLFLQIRSLLLLWILVQGLASCL